MKTILILALLMTLTSCLSSCRKIPDPNRSLIVEQCGITFRKFPNGDIDPLTSSCDCREYEYSLNRLGAVPGTITTYPLEYCQKLIGNKPKEYLKLTNFLGDLRMDLINASGKE